MNKATNVVSRIGFGVLTTMYVSLVFAFAYTFI